MPPRQSKPQSQQIFSFHLNFTPRQDLTEHENYHLLTCSSVLHLQAGMN
uniref:Uncharacterized protein n=1 Tax=Aegilops tauschii subsp. strangulata TaxID=200361 RepID=A0A453Q7Z6_AEGTS